METYLGLEVGGRSSQEESEVGGTKAGAQVEQDRRRKEQNKQLSDRPVSCESMGKTYPVE